MKSIALFNNKGGVGKTSLVYHLAWMLAEQGQRVVVADLDPQSNLSGMFLNEEALEEIWQEDLRKTIDGDIKALFAGTGDIATEPHIERVDEHIGLLPGDLGLSKREDELSAQWPKCLDGDERAFRVVTAFARLIDQARKNFQADIVLIDIGPNLGAINRSALIASDRVVIPLAPDLFSLQGLRNVGPILEDWRKEWKDRSGRKPKHLDIDLPSGDMRPIGYIVMRHTVHLSRPVKAYARWMEKIPQEYSKSVLQQGKIRSLAGAVAGDLDRHCLAHLKDYRSLMPLAQEANKPMFMLKPADGIIGGQQQAVNNCYQDFSDLSEKILSLV